MTEILICIGLFLLVVSVKRYIKEHRRRKKINRSNGLIENFL